MDRNYNLPKISLFCTMGGANKEYHAEVVEVAGGFAVQTRHGKRGAAKPPKGEPPVVTYEQAIAEFESIVKDKKSARKGYTEDESGTGYATSELAGRMSGNQPHLLVPMDEDQFETLLNDDAWGMQEKINGERLMADRKGDQVTTSNKLGLINTVSLDIVNAILSLDVSDILLDGELLDGKMYVFDILRLNGRDLTALGAEARYDIYNSFDFPAHLVKVPMAIGTKAKYALMARVSAAGGDGEGLVGKLRTGTYVPGRASPTMAVQLKHKFIEDASCVVLKPHATKRSVQVGLLNLDGTMREVGSVTIPANAEVPAAGDVIDVRYRHLFQDGALCEPVYLKHRTDVLGSECSIRQVNRVKTKMTRNDDESDE